MKLSHMSVDDILQMASSKLHPSAQSLNRQSLQVNSNHKNAGEKKP